MIEAAGHRVTKTGRGYAVDGELRVDRVSAGHWVACDHYGNAIGDNIDLARHLHGDDLSFTEAVFLVTGGGAVVSRDVQPAEPLAPPTLPAPTPEARKRGRRYLEEERGISPATLDRAEKAGMLAYADGAVMFVGRNAGSVRCVTARATSPTATVQKRDLKGSDKGFPPILPGDPRRVHVVEGGTDALALHDLAARRGLEPPTVIVSGGAGVRRWGDNEAVKTALRGAERVTVWRDVENTQEKQLKTDAAHEKQAEMIREINPAADVRLGTPKGKDLAEQNQAEAQRQREAEAQAWLEAEAQARRRVRPVSRDQDPSPSGPGF